MKRLGRTIAGAAAAHWMIGVVLSTGLAATSASASGDARAASDAPSGHWTSVNSASSVAAVTSVSGVHSVTAPSHRPEAELHHDPLDALAPVKPWVPVVTTVRDGVAVGSSTAGLAVATVDQPLYWPQERVHLTILFPGNHGAARIVIRPNNGSILRSCLTNLDSAGAAVLVPMSGERTPMALGQYHVDVSAFPDGPGKALDASTQFAVVPRGDTEHEAPEESSPVDVARQNRIEAPVPTAMLPGAAVQIIAHIHNASGHAANLTVSGNGVKGSIHNVVPLEDASLGSPDDLVVERGEIHHVVPPGESDFSFTLAGTIDDSLLDLTLADTSGHTLARRRIRMRPPGEVTFTTRSLSVSGGTTLDVLDVSPDREVTVFAGPGPLLRSLGASLAQCAQTRSRNSEAIAACVACRACALHAIHKRFITDTDDSDSLAADIRASLEALDKEFIDSGSHLVRPLTGMPGDARWTPWVVADLRIALRHMRPARNGHPALASSIRRTGELIATLSQGLSEHGDTGATGALDVERFGLPGPQGTDWRPLNDDSVGQFVRRRLVPYLGAGITRRMSVDDDGRVERMLSRTPELIAGIQALKVRWIEAAGHPREQLDALAGFSQDFPILTDDPDRVWGPGWDWGIHIIPHVFDLLLLMSEDYPPIVGPVSINDSAGVRSIVRLRDGVARIAPFDATRWVPKPTPDPSMSGPDRGTRWIAAPRGSFVLSAGSTQSGLADSARQDADLTATISPSTLRVGDEAALAIALPDGIDPVGAMAIVVLPATLVGRQPDDVLGTHGHQTPRAARDSDDNASQVLAVPFRGARRLRILAQGAFRGKAPGQVIVCFGPNGHDRVWPPMARDSLIAPIAPVTVR